MTSATKTNPLAHNEHTSAFTFFDLLSPTDIKVHPDNVRSEVVVDAELEELARSIAAKGILEPVVVAPAPPEIPARSMGKAKYVLIAGERRLTAAKLAKVKKIPSIIRRDLNTRELQIESMLVENLHRKALTAVEEGDGYQLLLEFPGATQKDLAAKVGQPVGRIRERIKVAKLPVPVRDRVAGHQITIKDALAIQDFDGDDKTQKRLLDAAADGRLAYTLQEAKNQRDHEARVTAQRKAAEDAGYVVHDEKPTKARYLHDLGFGYGGWDLDRAQAEHGSCEGRTAWMEYGQLKFGCDQPKLHKPAKAVAPKKSAAEVKREQEEKEANVRRAEVVEAHTAAVTSHLAGILNGDIQTSAPADLTRALLVSAVKEQTEQLLEYGTDELHRVSAVIGVAFPTDENGKPYDYYELTSEARQAFLEALDAKVAGLKELQLAVVLDLLTRRSAGIGTVEWLLGTYVSDDNADAFARWEVHLATAYGYVFSDAERETLTYSRDNKTWTVDGVPEPQASDDAEDQA